MHLVRVTQIEQFRKWITGCFYVNEQSVIDSLSGEFQGNNKTRIGTAGHKVVEEGMDCTYLNASQQDWIVPIEDEYCTIFNRKQINELVNHRNTKLQDAFHEQKYGKEYQTKHYPIHVGGTIDIIHGITLRDSKFVFRSPDFSNYTESCQWKFYLEFLGLDIFYFDLFEFKGYKDEMKLNVSALELIPHEEVQCIRYKNMEQDNQKLLEQFVDWIEIKNLRHLLLTKEQYFGNE